MSQRLMDITASSDVLQGDATQKRMLIERENPFNKMGEDADINESEILQQIISHPEMSADCIDRKTLSILGIDLSSESSLEDFVRHFDDTIGRCFKVEPNSDGDKRLRQVSVPRESSANQVQSQSVSTNGSCHVNLTKNLRTVWHKIISENALPSVNGWHKPFATQLYVRSMLKQRQSAAESESGATTNRYSVTGATESTKALLDTRRRSKYEEQCGETDENELRACFDLHSLITAELPANLDEPFKSADEVLAEIDQIMQDGAGMAALEADTNISPTALELLHFKEQGGTTAADLESSTFASNLRNLSVGALSEYLEELEVIIRQLSEQLVQELADREEIELEREIKSEFISLMTALQKRQSDALAANGSSSKHVSSKSAVMSSSTGPVEQHSLLSSPLSRLRKMSRSTSNVANGGSTNTTNATAAATSSGGANNPNLFTSIPYHASNGPPDCELLQRFIVLLHAVLENRANVPQLLTDYILNVYAPPPSDTQSTIKFK